MNKNLPQKYKDNIFYKFFRKLKCLFFKESENVVTFEEKENTTKTLLNDLKVDVKFDVTKFKRKEFIKDLEDCPELLQQLSNERLEVILQYYIEENEKKRKMIANLN